MGGFVYDEFADHTGATVEKGDSGLSPDEVAGARAVWSQCTGGVAENGELHKNPFLASLRSPESVQVGGVSPVIARFVNRHHSVAMWKKTDVRSVMRPFAPI